MKPKDLLADRPGADVLAELRCWGARSDGTPCKRIVGRLLRYHDERLVSPSTNGFRLFERIEAGVMGTAQPLPPGHAARRRANELVVLPGPGLVIETVGHDIVYRAEGDTYTEWRADGTVSRDWVLSADAIDDPRVVAASLPERFRNDVSLSGFVNVRCGQSKATRHHLALYYASLVETLNGYDDSEGKMQVHHIHTHSV